MEWIEACGKRQNHPKLLDKLDLGRVTKGGFKKHGFRGEKDLKNHWVPPDLAAPPLPTWNICSHGVQVVKNKNFFQHFLNKSCYKANPLEKLGKGCSNYRVMLTTGDTIQLKYLILHYWVLNHKKQQWRKKRMIYLDSEDTISWKSIKKLLKVLWSSPKENIQGMTVSKLWSS